MAVITTLDKDTRQRLGHLLSEFLADTFLLYTKTLNFHWNVVDSRFFELHRLFEKQYKDLAEAIDEIAERIRALKIRAPGTMREFLDLSGLEESTSALNGNQMLEQLLRDHTTVIEQIRQKIDLSAKLGDDGTADLLIQRLRVHEKAAWMLQSHLSRGGE